MTAHRTKKDAHHLWRGERDESGKIRITRTEAEREMFDQDEAREVAAACWGLYGASLTDSPTLTNPIPRSVAKRFNESARNQEAPRVRSWDELRKAFGNDTIREIRADIADGMRVRMASVYLDLPFVATKDVLDAVGDTDKYEVREIVRAVRSGKILEARKKYGRRVSEVSRIYKRHMIAGRKLAVDDKAEKYWEDYYGPYGSELIREVKKRVKADLAERWMTKHSVDEQAARYYANYYGEYGEDWVRIIPKMLSPVQR